MNTIQKKFWLGLVIYFSAGLGAQAAVPDKAVVAANLKKHVYFLASDKLQGRLTGTPYERKAGDYIAKQFKKYGLTPLGEKGTWFQTFTFHAPYSLGAGNSLEINGKKYAPGHGYYPLVYSASGKSRAAAQVVQLSVDDTTYVPVPSTAGQTIYLVDLASKQPRDPHSMTQPWRGVARRLKDSRPVAVFFYNSPDSLTVKAFRHFHNLAGEDMLMAHLDASLVKEIQASAPKDISLNVDLRREEVKARNVAGYIDNGKPYTIIIGAHYDHLGHDEYANSLYRGKPDIHNGADDNASGTASLMELARLIKASGLKDYNFAFVAFSGEELGLLGSGNFAKNGPLKMTDVQGMINMDMVGRLDSTTRELGIYGVGTSPAWDSLMKTMQGYDFRIKTTESGMGNSDHSSFYLQNVPAIHFFTGNHKDYHKPGDDADKINYAGMADVVSYIYDLTDKLDHTPRIAFRKTKEEKSATPRFKVTLGIIPDYFYEGGGIRADGVSPGKAAEKAGLQAGDVITQLGGMEVKDMQGYMEALSKLAPGQATTVVITRGGQPRTLPIQF